MWIHDLVSSFSIDVALYCSITCVMYASCMACVSLSSPLYTLIDYLELSPQARWGGPKGSTWSGGIANHHWGPMDSIRDHLREHFHLPQHMFFLFHLFLQVAIQMYIEISIVIIDDMYIKHSKWRLM